MPTYTSAIIAVSRRIFPKKQLNILFKAALILALGVALYFELQSRKNLEDLYHVFVQQCNAANWVLLAVVGVLMPLNWLIETLKWQPFLRHYDPISLKKSFYAVMAGISFALFTPNRMGEYAGRLLYVRPENHWKSLMINVL